jgi:hypothetical protein
MGYQLKQTMMSEAGELEWLFSEKQQEQVRARRLSFCVNSVDCSNFAISHFKVSMCLFLEPCDLNIQILVII